MTRSETLFATAQRYLPGGVNSPVRAFGGVGGTPVFFKRGKGPLLYDEDDKAYIDYVGSWGALLLGHADREIGNALQAALQQGLSFGAPTEIETQLAKKICELVPSIEKVRMLNSGTEATMTALRLARGYTGKDLIFKFQGCYHGHSDSLLIEAGSGPLTLGKPSSLGVPEAIAQLTVNLPFNDEAALTAAFERYGERLAGVIIEPVPANMGCVLPNRSFLQHLRGLCSRYGALLIFDEVITGFRVALAGAQSLYQIEPDLTTFGKIIGAGLPIGVLGGKSAILDYLAPQGNVYQAGTLAGNVLSMTAGLITLDKLTQNKSLYTDLAQMTNRLTTGLEQLANHYDIALQINWLPGLFSVFFTSTPVQDYQTVMQCDRAQFTKFFHGMLAQGIYLAPSAFESAFLSVTHQEEHITQTLNAAEKVFSHLKP